MRNYMILGVFLLAGGADPAAANVIQSACLSAGRASATPQVCACIQAAANRTLTQSDQRLAAGFFRDPHRAQEIRQSDSRRHEQFWERYVAFGDTAEAICVPKD